MRILLILKYIPSRTVDLKGDLLWSVFEALESAGVNVTLLTDGKVASNEKECIKIRYHWALKLIERIANKIARFIRCPSIEYFILRHRAYLAVAEFHRKHPIDAVVSECTSFTPAIIANEVHKRLGLPYVIREHQNYESRINSLNNVPVSYIKSIKNAQRVAAVSEGQAQTIRNTGIRDDIAVIPNPLSRFFFTYPLEGEIHQQTRRVRELKKAGIVFGAWTRWRHIKRLDLLIEAFSAAFKRNNQIRLVIAGPVEIDLEEIFQSPHWEPIADAVQFLGPATRQDIHRLAFSVDCIVVPSDFETFALPVVEGMAAGKPAIVTRCNGPEGLIPDSRFGLVVDRGSCDQLAESILYMADHLSHFDRDLIRAHAIELYRTDRIGERYVRLISSAIIDLTGSSGIEE